MISKDSFSDTKNFKEVEQQAGTPIVDADLNESRKQLWVEQAEVDQAAFGKGYAAGTAAPAFGSALSNDWQCYGTGVADIFIRAGVLIVDGMRIVVSADIDLVVQGFTFPPIGGGAGVFGLVVLEASVVRIDGNVDPSIIVSPSIGGTSNRYQLQYVFRQAESTVSFATAYAGMPALPSPLSAPARIWKGDAARIVLARYYRATGSTVIANTDIVDMRMSPTGEALCQAKFLKTIRAGAAEGAGLSDAMIVWNASTGNLAIGIDNAQNNAVTELQIGWLLRQPGAPDHLGAQVAGWAIPDGSALGYQSLAVSNAMLTKKTLNDSPREFLYDTTGSTLTATPSPLFAEKLLVDVIDNFIGDRASFVICTRVGNDLVWCNGQVTRGDGTLNVLTEIGGTPSPYTALVSQAGHGLAHATQQDAVERALRILTPGAGAGNLGAGNIFRLRVGRGSYTMSMGIKQYGQAAEIVGQLAAFSASNNGIELEGDGAGVTQVVFSNPLSAGRSSGDVAVARFAAGKIVLRGLTIGQSADSTHQQQYLLELQGQEVILEDCVFNGAVRVIANVVSISRCQFVVTASVGYTVFNGAAPIERYASCLYVAPNFTIPEPAQIEIKQNYFGHATSPGTWACVVLETGSTGSLAEVSFDVCKNIFQFGVLVGAATTPAIHLNGSDGDVWIHHNEFLYAPGVGKAGNSTSAGSVPFNGNYNGTPLLALAGYVALTAVATAYISCVNTRSFYSKTVIDHNHFDLTDIGTDLAPAHMYYWGACMFVFNSITAGGGALALHNIEYAENLHSMYQVGAGWPAAGADAQLVLWGFYLAALMADGQSLNDVLVDNIVVTHNKFDLGGDSSLSASLRQTWRGVSAPMFDAWGATFEPLESSCLIGIVLRNVTYAGSIVYAGRYGSNICISENMLSQRALSVSGGPALALIPIDTTAYPRYSFIGILVDGGDIYSSANVLQVPAEGSSPTYYATGNCVLDIVIANNRVEFSVYSNTNSSSSITSTGVGILLNNGFGATISGNCVYAQAGASTYMTAIIGYAKDCVFTGNKVKAGIGITGSNSTGGGFASSNLTRGCVLPFSGVVTAFLVDDNF